MQLPTLVIELMVYAEIIVYFCIFSNKLDLLEATCSIIRIIKAGYKYGRDWEIATENRVVSIRDHFDFDSSRFGLKPVNIGL
jgi:hypothetical protein